MLSGNIKKYEYLTGEHILPSNQQQIIEQAKFSYSPLGKAFEKQIKTIEEQGKKQVDALGNLKPKGETKPIADKYNNKSKGTIIFNDLINKRKALMKELYDSVDYSNLEFVYVDHTKDVILYKYKNSEELFDATKNNQIKFSEVKNEQNEFLNKVNNIKVGKKTIKKKETINNFEKVYISREEVINFFREMLTLLK